MTRALCAFLLLFGVSWPTSADNAKPLTTILLVARAELSDSNFKDSVVLFSIHHGQAAEMGLGIANATLDKAEKLIKHPLSG